MTTFQENCLCLFYSLSSQVLLAFYQILNHPKCFPCFSVLTGIDYFFTVLTIFILAAVLCESFESVINVTAYPESREFYEKRAGVYTPYLSSLKKKEDKKCNT